MSPWFDLTDNVIECNCAVNYRIEDIEKEVVLPAINQEIVLMDLDPYAVLSYNAMQAIVAINAIDSERRDEVCSFHI